MFLLNGSYAKGTATSDSDIDIAVIVDKLDSDYLDEHAILFKLRRSVDSRIEPVLIEYDEDESGFLREVMNTGYVLYPPAVQKWRNHFLSLLEPLFLFVCVLI